jgi:hypothetical protein
MTDVTNTDADEIVERTKIANRLWLDSKGETAKEEEAVAVSYEFLGREAGKTRQGTTRVEMPADGKAFTHTISQPGTRAGMLEGFGALTLMGNVTNSWMNEKGDRPATAFAAIEDRWQLLDSGVWIDRSGVGARVDKNVLAQAVVNVAARKGVTKDLASVLAKLESDDEMAKSVRGNPEFGSEYASLMGRTVKSVDDVLAGL